MGMQQSMLAELMRDYPEDIPDEPLDMHLNDLQDMINVMDIMEEEKETPVVLLPLLSEWMPVQPLHCTQCDFHQCHSVTLVSGSPNKQAVIAAILGTWSPNKANLTPEDPTQRSYLDAFYDDEYDDSDNTDNSGFFSEPNFKHGVMTPDIWDMFKSDWGQKVQ